MNTYKVDYFEEFKNLVESDKIKEDCFSLLEILKISNKLFLEYKSIYIKFFKKLEKALESFKDFKYIYDIEFKNSDTLCITLYLKKGYYDGDYYHYYYSIKDACLFNVETKGYSSTGKDACEYMAESVLEMINYFKENPKIKDCISFCFDLNEFFKGSIFINKSSSLSRNYDERFYFNFSIENKLDYNKEKISYKVKNGEVFFEKKYSPSLAFNNYLKNNGEVNILNNIFIERNKLSLIFGNYYEYVEKYDIEKLVDSLKIQKISFFQKFINLMKLQEDDE